ncbi:hypothetical protein FNF31_01721 [Cafeteria roenbergensis]|uniref:Uncharacterized protein n=1 Tax=Cafeteria roenbergensis TaxID=33653 RepID=A0A5A8DM26_CAFRO|nr:hypothetical protein FNF31_01721 [Cafeteria roenbergensis]
MQAVQQLSDALFASVPIPPSAESAWHAYTAAVSDIARLAFIVQLTDLIGSARVAAWYRVNVRRPVSWHQSLLVVLIVHFGGTTMTGIMTGKSPSWVTSYESLLAVIVSWYLTFFCPFDLWWRVYNVPWVNRACVVFESISLANGIGNLGVGKVLDHSRGHFAHPGTAPSPVLGWVCGIMSGCGGGVLSEFANFVDDPTPHSRRPQKAHRRRFARALVGSSVIMLCVWPRSGRVEDFNDCDIEGPIALAALLFTLDGLGLASRALAWPLGSAAWLLPGFRSVFVPNLAGLANGPEATWGKLRARARRVIATAGVRTGLRSRWACCTGLRAGDPGQEAGSSTPKPNLSVRASALRGASGAISQTEKRRRGRLVRAMPPLEPGTPPASPLSPAASDDAGMSPTPGSASRARASKAVRELAAERLTSDAVLMPYARDKAVPREVLARHRVDLQDAGVDEEQALAYIGIVLGCTRGRASKLLEEQAAVAAQAALECDKVASALHRARQEDMDEPPEEEDEETDELAAHQAHKRPPAGPQAETGTAPAKTGPSVAPGSMPASGVRRRRNKRR